MQITADAAGLAPVAAKSVPANGTFWVIKTGSDGNLTESPYPLLPSNLSTLPIYSVAGNIFMVDNTGGLLLPTSAGRLTSLQAAATAQTQAASLADLIDLIQTKSDDQTFQPDGITPLFFFDTNGLWLEIVNTNSAAINLWLRLHGTVDGDNYQLLSTTNLVNTNWNPGQILFGAGESSVPVAPGYYIPHLGGIGDDRAAFVGCIRTNGR